MVENAKYKFLEAGLEEKYFFMTHLYLITSKL